ncbi:MAG TPA: YdbL family protein [Sphingomicrobium sp.]|nr:YdbL family protein [Sphingomicrobium sp.]
MISVAKFACFALLALPAAAVAQRGDALASARAAGLVGERYDGYLGYVAGASEAARRQAGGINIRRRLLYTGLAGRRNANVQEVGIAAGCQLLAAVKVGEVYMLGDGKWRRRAPGQIVPLPAYCAR